MTARPLRILTFSTLFPNAAQPIHGVFVENRLRHLLATGEATAEVVAPTPWFPIDHARFGAYAAFARVPRQETRHGVSVHHPRYLTIPRVGMTVAPALLYLAAKPFIARLLRAGHAFDLIDAHYFYPDGVAAVMMARDFGLPVTITGRGTDLNLIPDYALPRRQIQWAAARADGMITVCQALKDRLVELGANEARVRVLRNGVDLQAFRPFADRAAARTRLGLTGPTILSVGHLIERKGHHLIIDALAALDGYTLLIAGDGEERAHLEVRARERGVTGRVRFLGRVDHAVLPEIYTVADALVLASSREGWANVLLESMACGTPVAATDVWGTAEAVTTPEAGVLIPERTAPAIAAAVRQLFAGLPDRTATRAYAELFSWDATSQGQLDLFREILARRAAG